ncbi:MAG: hypothetical protein U5J63_03935 [Fodinibius sp.]|nr:hypothetical protein [Fodinibius sp.]
MNIRLFPIQQRGRNGLGHVRGDGLSEPFGVAGRAPGSCMDLRIGPVTIEATIWAIP